MTKIVMSVALACRIAASAAGQLAAQGGFGREGQNWRAKRNGPENRAENTTNKGGVRSFVVLGGETKKLLNL